MLVYDTIMEDDAEDSYHIWVKTLNNQEIMLHITPMDKIEYIKIEGPEMDRHAPRGPVYYEWLRSYLGGQLPRWRLRHHPGNNFDNDWKLPDICEDTPSQVAMGNECESVHKD